MIRTALDPAFAKAGMPWLEKTLSAAQRELPKFQLTKSAIAFTTSRGLPAARLEADFVPRGKSTAYHRVHVVVQDGNALVHVLYTAAKPDYEQAALNLVVDSIHRGEG